MDIIDFEDFSKVELRVGTVIEAADFPEAKKPAIKMVIDFGSEIGIKKSSAQITKHYNKDSLVGKQVVCVVNFKPRQIGPFMSECLTTGFADDQGGIVLVSPDMKVPNGAKLL